MEDALVARYQTDYMEKVFYFCLKKVGNSADAEELASDITVNVLAALRKGTSPAQFSGWVWSIARNRYAAWAKRKHRQSAVLARDDIAAYELPDDQASVEEQWLHAEQLRLLRRELAFISREYREIIAAYYLESKRIAEIAQAMQLPPGTVMTKLHRARRSLKEGMDMAREFGKRSYQPENIGFQASGNQPSGLPFRAIERMIPKNILCAANNNPSTIQELSMELGIATPYMEEEVRLLADAELLKKLDHDRYMTSFFISPRECQEEILSLSCDYVAQQADAIWQVSGALMDKLRATDCDLTAYAQPEAHMYFALLLDQTLSSCALPENIFSDTFHRRDGGNWGILGLEHGATCRLPQAWLNNECCFTSGCEWNGFQATYWNGAIQNNAYHTRRIYEEDYPSGHLLPLMRAITQGKAPSAEQALDLTDLLDTGICRRREDGTLYVNALILPAALCKHEVQCISDTPEYQALLESMRQYVAQVRDIVAKHCHEALKDDFDYYVAISLALRPILAAWLAEHGYYTGNQAQFCAFYC